MAPFPPVQIHYLYHSGFAVEISDYMLIFDYYRGDIGPEKPLSAYGRAIIDRLKDYKQVLVFASHSHFDHFNPAIFDWLDAKPDIKYILSYDIDRAEAKGTCYFVRPYEELEVAGVKISVFGSTDIGVSFLTEVEGIKLFHAGDLNWWHWPEESTEAELTEAELQFKNEVSRLACRQIDIMFFPVDPRLKEHYYIGGEYIIRNVRPSLFVPMHFAHKTGITERFAKLMAGSGTETAVISSRGQTLSYIKK
ncbi:MAG TPA: MBL fold metallo-hydrolase [Candidatus Atribacteria bacterium]|nr:MBL fold metallo-hydrolase [Candidatus Atribacteria bacterium]HPT79160.1 MBL fold metallo-hydrolase [Candidatus Atribacteria bacterium]